MLHWSFRIGKFWDDGYLEGKKQFGAAKAKKLTRCESMSAKKFTCAVYDWIPDNNFRELKKCL